MKPILIDATSGENGYTRLLGGPPQRVSMRSGKVVLQPDEAVGKHSPEKKEELIIILEGEGQFLFGDNHSLVFDSNSVLYCSPMTDHNVINTGATPLTHINVIAKALE